MSRGQSLINLLQSGLTVTVDGNSTRLYWGDDTHDWRVIYWQRNKPKTLYQGVDLEKAIEVFTEHESA
jgi:hypothetical protein